MNVAALITALRPTQWLKNLVLFAAITFNGELFNLTLLTNVLYGFISFCLLSSGSYLINDLRDLPYDRRHPIKRHRPIPSGKVGKIEALITAFILTSSGLILGYNLSQAFFLIGLLFLLVHIGYTFWLKGIAVFDIVVIAFSFTIRAFAGEIATGFHIPIWLMLTVIFLSLFVASSKRHSELLRSGVSTRPALESYRERLLDFYATTFATATVISYALFVFFEEPPTFNLQIQEFLTFTIPTALQRKWLVLTLPFVLLGIMRYAQIIYEKKGGEAPEKLITQDAPLLLTVIGWGLMVIVILYLA